MPLTTCPACHRDVADNPQECPYCGVIFAKWHGHAVRPASPTAPPTQQQSSGLSLSLANPKAVEWAKAHAAESTQDIDDEVRSKIRDLVSQAVAAGMHPRAIAKEIVPWLKLTDSEIQQVAAYREERLAKGYKEERLEKAILRYSQQLLEERAELIARTEMMKSYTRGQESSWQQAVADGHLNPEVTRRIWIATPGDERTCEICLAMHDKKAHLNEPFQTPLGPIQEPPLHDGCRCCTGLVFDRSPHPFSG